MSFIAMIATILMSLSFGPANAAPYAEDSTPNNWEALWERVPVSKLPTLVPDGEIADFRLALNRQKQNCKEFREGKFSVCAHESPHFTLICDDGVIDGMLEFTRTSKNWAEVYDKAKKSFDWYRYKAQPAVDKVLFTGYNAPLFKGSLTSNGADQYPIYSRPSDLVDIKGPDGLVKWMKRLPDGSLVPYDDRKAIDLDRVLAGKNLEVAYMEYPSDILRLQIEGSGILEVSMADGSKKQYGMNYAGKNGRPFVSVFKYLRDKGVDKKYLTFPGLKQYFIDYPNDMWPALITNPSYVFFSVGEEPPCGTIKVHITGGHSLAVDPTQLPYGLTAFFQAFRPVEGSDPDLGTAPMKAFTRFAVAQDTGGPIKGAHVDVYWGSGDYAQLASNLMATRGTLFIPRSKKRTP